MEVSTLGVLRISNYKIYRKSDNDQTKTAKYSGKADFNSDNNMII